VQQEFDTVFGSAYSTSFFTTWGPENAGQAWLKCRGDLDWELEGALCTIKQHPLPGHDALHCTEQGGAAGPWHERLPHFKLDFTPSSGLEWQTEYLVPRAEAPRLLEEFERLAPVVHPLLFISEIRTMAADDLWLSGAYGRDTVGFHFTWLQDPRVLELLPALDDVFARAGGRAHWGKLHASADYASRYPRLADFRALRSELDPAGKFANAHLGWLSGT
jgi:xylitol oxidase